VNDSLSTCGPERRLIPVSARGQHLVVDIHCHLGIAAADTMLRAAMPDAPAALPFSSPASDKVNRALFASIGPRLNGIDERLADMDRLGVDVQVNTAILPIPTWGATSAAPSTTVSRPPVPGDLCGWSAWARCRCRPRNWPSRK
jgi:aminocarboxymuconate-semialdehyde decarboxylase